MLVLGIEKEIEGKCNEEFYVKENVRKFHLSSSGPLTLWNKFFFLVILKYKVVIISNDKIPHLQNLLRV